MPDQSRKLKIVHHAYERGKQFQLSPAKMVWLFWNSEPEKSPPGRRETSPENTRYFRNGTYVMVAAEVDDRETGEPMYLLLTIYDQRMDLHPKYLYK